MGGPCNACQHTSRHCFFIPRHKAGRRRRRSTTITTASSSIGSPLHSPQVDPVQQHHRRTFGHFETDNNHADFSCPLERSAGLVTSNGQLLSPPLPLEPREITQPPKDTSFMGHLGDLTHNVDYFNADAPPMLDYSSSSSSEATHVQAVPYGIAAAAHTTTTTTTDPLLVLASKITEMHWHDSNLKHMGTTSASFEASKDGFPPQIVADIDVACKQAMFIVRNGSAEHDEPLGSYVLTAVMRASMIKVIMLIHSLIDAIEAHLGPKHNNNKDASPQTLGNDAGLNVDIVMVLKQLDLSLTEAKLSLLHLARKAESQSTAETSRRTRDLHLRISTMIDSVCEDR